MAPPRHDGLFGGIDSFQALLAASGRAIRGKRRKPGAAAFMANLETSLLRLERELRDGSWRAGRYLEIQVRDPKPRLVSAAPFRDRVVHQALCAAIEPLFERGFIAHSFANRQGKGTHRAIEVYERYRDRHAYVLRCDIFRYFPAMDHAILKADLRRRVACSRTLALMDRIVDGSNPQEPVNLYFSGDDLFTPFRRNRGLPIGNLTNQFFANVYLDGLDHYATEVLRAPYLRFVDDFALFADDPRTLERWRGHRRVSGATAFAAAPGQNRNTRDRDAGDVPRLRVAARRSPAAAAREREPLPRPAAFAARPLVQRHRGARRDRAAGRRVGRACPPRRYMAPARRDLPGWLVRSVGRTVPRALPAPRCRRVVRGGGWNNNPNNVRAANRNRDDTGNRNNNLGFRVASTPHGRSRRGQGRAGCAWGVQGRQW